MNFHIALKFLIYLNYKNNNSKINNLNPIKHKLFILKKKKIRFDKKKKYYQIYKIFRIFLHMKIKATSF
jgi:hypothetical protein